jgi:cyclopropane fatty-acyl-phospholipid synthase-like methyltransferase
MSNEPSLSDQYRVVADEVAERTMHLNWFGPLTYDVILSMFTPEETSQPWRMLDIGGGNGEFARRFLEMFPNGSVVCVNISERHLELSRKRLAPYGDRAMFIKDALENAANWQLPPFDLATALNVLHFVQPDNLEPVCRSVHSLLKPGGLFFSSQIVAHPQAWAKKYVSGNIAFSQRFQPTGDEGRRLQELNAKKKALTAAGAKSETLQSVTHTAQALETAYRAAGFADVDWCFRIYMFGMLIGRV